MDLRIRENCAQKGITQKELAAKLGVSEVTLSRAAKGNTSLQLLEKIATTLGVNIVELFAPAGDFTALIDHQGTLYRCNGIDELKILIEKLEATK